MPLDRFWLFQNTCHLLQNTAQDHKSGDIICLAPSPYLMLSVWLWLELVHFENVALGSFSVNFMSIAWVFLASLLIDECLRSFLCLWVQIELGRVLLTKMAGVQFYAPNSSVCITQMTHDGQQFLRSVNIGCLSVHYWPWTISMLRVTGPLCGEFTGHRWIPLTKASDAELWCFLWSATEETVE